MTRRNELEGVVRSWLREDRHEDADRVLDMVLADLDTTPQRRAGWLARRFPIMNNTTVRFGVAAVAVLVLALLGIRMLPGTNNSGGPPAEPTPTLRPSPTATLPPVPDGSLEGRRYLFGSSDVPISVEAPAGWEGCCGGGAISNPDLPGFAAILLFDVTEIGIYRDSCRWADSRTLQARGAEAVAEALAALDGRDPTGPMPATVAGRPAFLVRLSVPEDLEVEAGADGDTRFVDGGEFRTWDTTSGHTRYHQGAGQVDELYIFDVAERTFIVDVSYFADTTEAQRAALDAMLASIRIE